MIILNTTTGTEHTKFGPLRQDYARFLDILGQHHIKVIKIRHADDGFIKQIDVAHDDDGHVYWIVERIAFCQCRGKNKGCKLINDTPKGWQLF